VDALHPVPTIQVMGSTPSGGFSVTLSRRQAQSFHEATQL
jgi:hypothetical protein